MGTTCNMGRLESAIQGLVTCEEGHDFLEEHHDEP